jgi:hypothetical protein
MSIFSFMWGKEPAQKMAEEMQPREEGSILRLGKRKDLFIEEQRREVARRIIEDFHRRNWGLISLEFAGMSDNDIKIWKAPVV